MFTLKNIIKNNGATIKGNNEINLNRGYQVSIEDKEIIPVRKLRKSHLMELLKTIGDKCLGIWIDGGKAYIDISDTFTNKREALKFGRKNNQLSIWNWKTMSAINC